MATLGFYFDMRKCIGCKACQLACKSKNDLPVGVLYRHVRNFESGKYPDVKKYNYSTTCNHCSDPACVSNCPVGAMYVDDNGLVQHDDELCIGCKACMSSCPYGVPQYFEDKNIVGKCDACAYLLEKDENPACVSACVMRCLEFGDIDELKEKHGEDLVQELPCTPPADATKPNRYIKPKEGADNSDFKEVVL